MAIDQAVIEFRLMLQLEQCRTATDPAPSLTVIVQSPA